MKAWLQLWGVIAMGSVLTKAMQLRLKRWLSNALEFPLLQELGLGSG